MENEAKYKGIKSEMGQALSHMFLSESTSHL